MDRVFLPPGDVRDRVADQFRSGRRLIALNRLTGGSKKGVYRLVLDDQTTVILYLWAAVENYWPPAPAVPGDPFTEASAAELFATNHAALAGAGVPTPRLLMLDRDGRYLGSDLALIEDVGAVSLETLMQRDPAGAAAPLSTLGDAVRRMHTTFGPKYGKLVAIGRGEAPQQRRTEDIVVDRALSHLRAAADRDTRLAEAYERIAGHVRPLRETVTARQTYALVHGELGPDHVLVTPAGEPFMIDIESLAYFDVEWEHAWLQMRFREAYPLLCPVDVDPQRLDLYRYAQGLSLIEGPLRIANSDFPDRQWMLDLAEWNIRKALAIL